MHRSTLEQYRYDYKEKYLYSASDTSDDLLLVAFSLTAKLKNPGPKDRGFLICGYERI